ncbi:uncharacterized protein KY384_002440 [Bacidia gigantensis]|uniref:uncharacterized protein n=1 Tax=Bacidia gigantensis TaxID=2732470 RepID=UPI001D04E4F8|nr:uncharacterized protein KY384_002440 [Bacidia gigantensis]KAG8532563.1 hypothetical protein KY384_002440 [Bacidia gigantensis]
MVLAVDLLNPTPQSEARKHKLKSNKSIILRSIDEPSLSTQYTSHTTTTTVARFSPSGYYVASGDESGTVRVWDCTGNGITKGEYPIISGPINDIAWDGDSQRLIAVGRGKEKFGHCITADSGNTVGEIKGHSDQINCVSIRQQRPLRAATGGDDSTLVFYHGAPFKFNTSLKRHQRYIYGLAFSPDGSTLVSVGADRKIFLYDGKTGEAKGEIGDGEHKGSIYGVSWSRDSKRFTTCSADQTVKVWDVETGKAAHSWRLGSDEGVVSIPDHQVGVVWPPARSDDLIISLSLSGDLNYLSASSPNPIRVVQGQQKNITALTTSSSSSDSSPTLFTGSTDGRIYSYPTKTGAGSSIDGTGHSNYVSGLTSVPGKIFSCGWDDSQRSIDISSNTFTGSHQKTDGQARSIAATSKGIIVATHKGITAFSQSDDSVLKQVSTPSLSPTIVAANDTHTAVASDDNVLRIYSSTDLQLKHTLPAFPSAISSLSFSSPAATNQDHPYLAVGFSSGKILVFTPTDNFSEAVITRWSSHTGRVTSIAWDEGARRAVSGGLDTNIFVWSVQKPGGRVSVGSAHKEGVNGVVWINDSTVKSVGVDGCVKGWTVEGVV